MAHRCSKKTLLIFLLIAGWIAGTSYAFWWFQVRVIQPFDAQASLTPAAADALATALRARLAGTSPATVIHYWDDTCPCTRFNTPHLREIIATFQARGVRFAVVPLGGASDQAVRATFGPGVLSLPADTPVPPAAPAAVVLDDTGRLAYLGPYAVGVGCLTGSGRFVERALNALLRGERFDQLNSSSVGCYCPTTQHLALPPQVR